MNEKGVWSFSPVYDITYSSGPGGEHSRMYLGEGRNPTSEHLLKLAEKHGIKNGSEIVEEVKVAIGKWKNFATLSGVSNNIQNRIAKHLSTLR